VDAGLGVTQVPKEQLAGLVWTPPLQLSKMHSFVPYSQAPPPIPAVQPVAAQGPVVTQEPEQQTPPRQRFEEHSGLEVHAPPAEVGATHEPLTQVSPFTQSPETVQLV
jgi:hypothetical protein